MIKSAVGEKEHRFRGCLTQRGSPLLHAPPCSVRHPQAAKEMIAQLKESQEIAHKSRANMWRYGDCQSDDEDDF